MRKIYLLLILLFPVRSFAQDTSAVKTMDIYGFIMTDVRYNMDQVNPNWQDGLRPTKLPIYKDDPNFTAPGTIFFGVRQTRFGVKGYTPTKLGELKTQFEFELFGTGVDEGQTTIRLRHAYGQLGKWGVGQTWSPFMDIDIFPNTLEYWGPTGMAFFRNVQVRYMPIQGESFMTIALERPGASADQGNYSGNLQLDSVKGKFGLPDLSAEYRKAGNWGYVELAGIVRSIGWEDLGSDNDNLSDNVLGYGLNLTSNLKFGKAAVARLGVVYGSGIQNYMNDATADVGVKPKNDTSLQGVVVPMLGMSAFLDYQWSEKFSSSIGYSMIKMDLLSEQPYETFESGQYGLVNLLYYPAENMMCGVEFGFGARKNKNSGDGYDARPSNYKDTSSATHIQFSFKYNFASALYKKG